MDDSKSKTFSLKQAIEKRKLMSTEEVISTFDEWAKNGKYEKDMVAIGNKGVEVVTKAANDYFTSGKENIKVIDVAAGTGLAAEGLKRFGFCHIDGIDPSIGMKNVALSKNIYNQYYTEFVDGHKTDIESDIYDCAVISGGLSQGLLPCNALFEIIRIVKPGGVICIEMIESNLTRVQEFVNRLSPLWDQFIQDGVWKVIRKEKIEELVTGETGLLMVYQVLVSEALTKRLPVLNNNICES